MAIVGQIPKLSYRYSARLAVRDTRLIPLQAQSLYHERDKDG